MCSISTVLCYSQKRYTIEHIKQDYDFNVEKNRKTISYIESLEEYILNKLIPKNNVRKIYKKNCSQQLKKGFIYITKDNEPDNFNTSYTEDNITNFSFKQGFDSSGNSLYSFFDLYEVELMKI